MTKRSRAPDGLIEHLVAVFHQEFSSFNWRRFWADLFAGSGIAILGLLISIAFDLSIRQDWEEHPVVLVLLALLPGSILLIDVSWRCFRALKRLYLERTQINFREPINTGAVLLSGWLFIASLCWYITYISAPHFFAQIAEIGTSEVADYDPAVGVLMLVDLHNTGVPSPIKNWKLFLTFPSGEKAMTDWRVKRILLARKTHKEMVITPPYDHDLEEQAGNTAVGQTWVHGNISFVFFGYRDQAVDVPGSIFKLTFEDKLGQVYSARCKLTGRKRMAITPQAFLPSEDRKESEGALTGSETRDLKPKSPYHSRTANLVLSA